MPKCTWLRRTPSSTGPAGPRRVCERQVGLAIPQRQARRQRGPGPFARGQGGRQPGLQREHLRPRPRQKPSAGTTGEDCSQPPLAWPRPCCRTGRRRRRGRCRRGRIRMSGPGPHRRSPVPESSRGARPDPGLGHRTSDAARAGRRPGRTGRREPGSRGGSPGRPGISSAEAVSPPGGAARRRSRATAGGERDIGEGRVAVPGLPSANASLAHSTTVWMYSAGFIAASSKPASRASCCRKTGPGPRAASCRRQARVLQGDRRLGPRLPARRSS